MNDVTMSSLFDLNRAIRHEGGISRRLFLHYGAALASLPILANTTQAQTRPRFDLYPFRLGVASGDPDSHSVVLWTRLAPKPLETGGGMDPLPVEVQWELSEDESFGSIVKSGKAVAAPQLGHSVHVEVDGLKPDRWYWYRFLAGNNMSQVGRTRTLPEPSSLPKQLRFGVTSCQNYEQGLFTAYQQMARDEVDFVCHLGDYIYEYKAGQNGDVRTHLGQEIESLDDYRIRHAQYRSDHLLQSMHAVCPWFVTWDDHEFDNNCANGISEEKDIDPLAYMRRRANAYQAYYEMMPLRRKSLPRGPHLQLYRRASFGSLAELLILDTRQYRTDQPNDDRKSPLNAAALAPENSLLGSRQRNWLYQSLLDSNSTWNVLAQQVMMGMVGFPKESEQVYSMDQWPGYTHERRRILEFMETRGISNPVVLTGDIHSNWANELRLDDRQPELTRVATEFVCTSLSSGGNGTDKPKGLDALQSANPCIKFHNRERGYTLCTVTPETWTSDYKVVSDVLKPGGKTFTRASFVVEAGKPIIQPA